MALDEQLRRLAEEVQAPPPGDASAALRRGARRRRSRRAAGVAASVGLVVVVGVAVTSLLEGPTLPEIADRPPAPTEQRDDEETWPRDDWPVVTESPSVTVAEEDPFEWAVAVAAGEDDRWCATAVRGSTQIADSVGGRCDQLLTPEQAGDPGGFGTGGSELEATPSGAPAQGLSWGLVSAATDGVVVLFTDGTRTRAQLASDGPVGATLWAIGYEGVAVQAVGALRDGEVIAGRVLAVDAADGERATPQAVYGDRLQRQDVEAFPAEQQRLLDLRASDELFRLPVEGTDRSVGIRARDGSVPLMFATACDVLDQMELPGGWIGLCLEYTDSERGRVRGLFPYGTTSGG